VPWFCCFAGSRVVTAAGRSLFARSYVRAYTAGSPDALRQVNSWLIVRIAARLAEGIDAERETLVALLEGARHKMPR